MPLAFRTGGRGVGKVVKVGKSVSREEHATSPDGATHRLTDSSTHRSRVHIFWQRRIRAGDTTTPWWFPAKTDGGAMREDRIVLPIPPSVHWSDEMPMILRPAE